MQLHHAHKHPDWHETPALHRNWWQRLAARTNGALTPGNAISTAGLCLVGLGLYNLAVSNQWLGVALIVVGRVLDMLDGYVADWTGTKSALGAQVDASFDKLAIFATLIVLLAKGFMPAWLVATLAALNSINIVLTLIARQRFVRMRPSRQGKLAAWVTWVAISCFAAGSITPRVLEPVLSHQNLFVAAYVFAGVALLLAIWAVYGYFSQTFGHTGEHYELLDKFDRFVIVNNPVSTDSFRLKERLRELTQLKPGSEIIVFDTVPGGRAANAELFVRLGDKLGPTTLVCIAGGDGTTNMVIDALMRHPSLSDGARKSPIFPLWCGNANDLAYILSGPPTRHPIHKVFRRGGVIRVRPLECTFTTGGKQTSYLAACYASFGASAFATMEMERTLRKKSPIRRFVVSRFGQEVIAAAWALMRAPTFAVSENGQRRVIFERTHFNGSRFAKIIGLPLRLTDERFHRATIEHKHLVSLVLRVLGLVGDRDLAKKTITRDEFTVHDDVWAQFDGEAVHIPADTAVEVRVSKHQFYAISTRLNR